MFHEERTTQCSTMHCRNRAKVKVISWRGKWWKPILNPAPFCEDCQDGNFPFLTKGVVKDKQTALNTDDANT